jgi:hypothetical protein
MNKQGILMLASLANLWCRWTHNGIINRTKYSYQCSMCHRVIHYDWWTKDLELLRHGSKSPVMITRDSSPNVTLSTIDKSTV